MKIKCIHNGLEDFTIGKVYEVLGTMKRKCEISCYKVEDDKGWLYWINLKDRNAPKFRLI